MTIGVMRKIVKTFTDWEIKEMLGIIGKDEVNKRKILTAELGRRKKQKYHGTYKDQTLNPKVPIRERLENHS